MVAVAAAAFADTAAAAATAVVGIVAACGGVVIVVVVVERIGGETTGTAATVPWTSGTGVAGEQDSGYEGVFFPGDGGKPLR